MKKFLTVSALFFLFPGISFSAGLLHTGGDIQLRSIYRNNFDLAGGTGSENWFDSYVRFYLDATPYPDVKAYVRVIGERDWAEEREDGGSATSIDLDLGYFEVMNLWNSRASFSIGRQELLYGEGFLIGRNDPYRTAKYERSPRKAFDSAVLYYGLDPFRLDFFGSVIKEGYGEPGSTLYGTNLNYDYLDTAAVDIGIFYKDEDGPAETLALSVRGESDIGRFPGLRVKAEVVPQIGKFDERRDRSAVGGYGGVEYLFPHTRMSCVPHHVHAVYYYMSGDDGKGDFGEFDPMFSDMFLGEVNQVNPRLGLNTNARIVNFGFGWHVSPAVDLDFEFYRFRLDEPLPGGTRDYGSEMNVSLAYRYNPDTEMVLSGGYFSPKPALAEKNALQIIAAFKLAF